MQLNEIEKEALKLPRKARSLLAEHLIESVEKKEGSFAENQKLWLEEAKRRYQKFCEGKTFSIPEKEVFKEALAAIK